MTDADQTTDAFARDWRRWCEALGANQAITHEDHDGALFALGVPAPPLNIVITKRRDVATSSIELLLDTVRKRKLPHQLEVRPGASNEVADLARSRGMRPGDSIPLMRKEASGTDLSTIARHQGLAIREIDAENAHLHLSIASAGFEVPESFFTTLMSPPVFAMPGFHCYVGTVADEPVTTAVGVVDGDHVSVYNVATLPLHRGRGYGAAITAAAVCDGFEAGADFALLQSSDAGFGLYESLGFRTLERWTTWISA